MWLLELRDMYILNLRSYWQTVLYRGCNFDGLFSGVWGRMAHVALGSQFPDQGLNPGHSSKSLES